MTDGDSADVTVTDNFGSANMTLTQSGDPNSTHFEEIYNEENSCRQHSYHPDLTDEELALEANASLIVNEIEARRMMGSVVEDDMFIENETLSLVSGGYTSDTPSDFSGTWSPHENAENMVSPDDGTNKGTKVFNMRGWTSPTPFSDHPPYSIKFLP